MHAPVCSPPLQEAVSKLRQEAKAHPKALQQLEKQKQALEKKLDGAARKEAALTRDNEALQVCLGSHITLLLHCTYNTVCQWLAKALP